MNEEQVQAEITRICKFVKSGKYFNRNTNASKKQIARLTELGLIDMMESNWRTASGFNYHQAAAVIKAADDAGSTDIELDFDDATVIKNEPSALYTLLNEDTQQDAEVVKTENNQQQAENYILDSLIIRSDCLYGLEEQYMWFLFQGEGGDMPENKETARTKVAEAKAMLKFGHQMYTQGYRVRFSAREMNGIPITIPVEIRQKTILASITMSAPRTASSSCS